MVSRDVLSKAEKTLCILDNLDKYYEIYGLEESGELVIYDYPFVERGDNDDINGITYDIICKRGVFLRGVKGLKRISKVIHDAFNLLFPDTIISRNWELDILNTLKYRRMVSEKDFDRVISGKETILFNNGKMIIKFPLDKTVTPYFPPNNRAYKSFQQLPISFDAEAECPKIEQFLIDTFGSEHLNFIYSIIGYLMSRSIIEQKAFVFYGEASTGKTTFIELITKFIGRDLISNVSLHGLGERFALGRTRDKRVNIYDDLSFAKIYNNSYGNFKQLVTNKSLSSEMKFINELVEWDNTCKCVFGCNQLPFIPSYADTDFFRRLILIPCRNKVKNKNKNILAEITTEEELSGLLNKALNGLAILVGQGGFPVEWDNIERVQNIWELNSKPSKMFVEEECVFGEDASIDVDLFNEILRKFRRDKNAIKISDRQIATSMRLYKNSVKLKRKQIDNVRYRFYDGIDIDPNSDYYKYKVDALELTLIPTSEKGQTTIDVIDEILVKKTVYDTFGKEINFGDS